MKCQYFGIWSVKLESVHVAHDDLKVILVFELWGGKKKNHVESLWKNCDFDVKDLQ